MLRILFLFLSIFCFAEEKVLFLHIPKSGGITVRSILQDRYPSGRSINVLNWGALDERLRAASQSSLITGHFYYHQVKDLYPDFAKITFLRDPVERVLSEHRYAFERDHNTPSKVLKQHFLPSEGDPIETAENVACRVLSRLNPLDLTIPIEAHLQSAKRVLAEDFDFVGITEHLEESMQLFFYAMGWKFPEWTPIHNTTDASRSAYPQSLLDEIAERNWADIELYRFANELFEKERLSITPIVKELIFEKRSYIDYNFASPLDGFGWCPREDWPEGTFRWLCSNEHGCMDLPLDADFSYSFQLELFLLPQLVSKLVLKVNGNSVQPTLKPINRSGEYRWYSCNGTISRSFLEEGKKTRFTISIADSSRTPARDSYRGRCGSKRMLFKIL